MKQHISLEQLEELTPDQQTRLRSWLESKHTFGETHLMLNIGTMIEFINEKSDRELDIWRRKNLRGEWKFHANSKIEGTYTIEEELCDILWHICKEVLNSESKV